MHVPAAEEGRTSLQEQAVPVAGGSGWSRARRRGASCLGWGRKGRSSGFTGREHSMENPSPGPGVPALSLALVAVCGVTHGPAGPAGPAPWAPLLTLGS